MDRKKQPSKPQPADGRENEEIFPVSRPVEQPPSRRNIFRIALLLTVFTVGLGLALRVVIPNTNRSAAAQPNLSTQAAAGSAVPSAGSRVVRTAPPRPTQVPTIRPAIRTTRIAGTANPGARVTPPVPQSATSAQASDFNPGDWRELPVIPAISETTLQIFQRGQKLGNDPAVFSKIGDCNMLSVRFLTYYDYQPTAYSLDKYTDLAPTIEYFKGSFMPLGQAVGDGYNTSAVLSPFRADLKFCKVNESPVACEYRLRRPSFVLVSIGTDDTLSSEKFEDNMRKIIDISIDEGVVPILSTLPDKPVKEEYNQIIATLAYEYDIPLWNLWRAFQPVVNEGMADEIHPSGEFAAFHFNEENLASWGWPVRNLTALQALDAVWKGVTNQAE